jgi:hypothetical protein
VTRRVNISLAAAGLVVAAVYPAAARVRKAPATAKKAPAPLPQEVLAEGVCRYVVRQGTEEPQDEVRFLFRSADLALPRRGAATPVLSFREYRQDLPEGAPESEQGVYDQEMARFQVTDEPRAPGQSGPERWSVVRAAPGLPPARESQVLGLPWLSLAAPKAGQSWQRTETIPFPSLKERFTYTVAEMTTVGGRRAWRVERTLAARPSTPFSFRELRAPARVVRWQETFWVDVDGRALLRAERHLHLATIDETPVELTLDVEWARKGNRPVSMAEYQERGAVYAKLTQIERKVQEAGSRTTLDGAADLREGYTNRRYQSAFDKVDRAIDGSLQRFLEQEQAPRQQGRAAPPFVLPDAQGRATALAAFRGRVLLLSFWLSS